MLTSQKSPSNRFHAHPKEVAALLEEIKQLRNRIDNLTHQLQNNEDYNNDELRKIIFRAQENLVRIISTIDDGSMSDAVCNLHMNRLKEELMKVF